MSRTWLEWYIVLGSQPSSRVQCDLILDCLEPMVAALGEDIDLFHFFRYFQSVDHVRGTWQQWPGFAGILQFLQGNANVNYITFRVRCAPGRAGLVRQTVDYRLTTHTPAICPLFGEGRHESVPIGLETYGGNNVHPLQHEYFHYISLISMNLLRLERQGLLTLQNRPCGTEEVAAQWSHMLHNQLGLAERELPVGSQLEQARLPDGREVLAVRGAHGQLRTVLFYDKALPL